ncbi:hypothetical protein CLV92_12611 [Kineococcus xinjiangensis]|uniref:Uncharacterized protein n=1 Tax=Kineococcus xinjiangensis TaxID=512762 RepID=A0A2S6IBY2_9ACTN|nr:hypothetical protein [Kineococcus xinjiangensis]PPK90202.1 hypothetical protein CLV92_12611 [Kineococcus xinjiangensis]
MLRVDHERDAAELARFWAKVVKGPDPMNCWLWVGAIADDGYGRFYLRRDRRVRVVRPNRYVLAAVRRLDLGSVEVAEHAVCDVPLCVRVAGDETDHIWASTQAANLQRMLNRARGGGEWWQHRWRGGDRASIAARSRALRDAVRAGWDADAVRAALDAPMPGQGILDLFDHA